MSDAQKLTLVRAVHTAIYVVMATACLALLYAGVTGATGSWLWIALGLVGIECVVFVGSGMKCPLTAVAVRYGATPERGFDTFFPEQITRHTLTVFGPMIVVSLVLLAMRLL